jgi:hypothetical protein
MHRNGASRFESCKGRRKRRPKLDISLSEGNRESLLLRPPQIVISRKQGVIVRMQSPAGSHQEHDGLGFASSLPGAGAQAGALYCGFPEMRALVLHEDYSREEVQQIFDPDSKFTPQAGTWGLQGIVQIPKRPGDYVFFVTFGRQQSDHHFDESISSDGVWRWQSQPKQSLADADIKKLIRHDEDKHSIYLFLRTIAKRVGAASPYTFLGRLKYLTHDKQRERPVHFGW